MKFLGFKNKVLTIINYSCTVLQYLAFLISRYATRFNAQGDRANWNLHFGVKKGRSVTIAIVLFLPKGLQLDKYVFRGKQNQKCIIKKQLEFLVIYLSLFKK